MSRIRQSQNPWLADHVIFFGYRWLAWSLAALPLCWLVVPDSYIWALCATGLLNIAATLWAQRYVRLMRHTPALMLLDIFCMVLLLHLARYMSASDTSAFFLPYAYSSLVLPALLFGWRGGIMTGLAFVTLDRAALWSIYGASDYMTLRDWVVLALVMVTPPLFGRVFPSVVELLRHIAAQGAGRTPPPPRVPAAAPRRAMGVDTVRFAALERQAQQRETQPLEVSLATQTAKMHAVEPGVEDLRRSLFAPLPQPDMDLLDLLDLLGLRFSQSTGVGMRVVMLGRARRLHPAYRSALVRLAQEAFLNVQRHAHASSAVCTLRYDAASVALLIQDNGVGLLDGTYERPGLHALRAMRYRLTELGGRLDVFETEGGGVTVRAIMPLE